MQAARPVLVPLVLLTLPLTSHAVPITENALVVDYEGTISDVRETPAEYTVGDRIAGRLLIDPRVPWYLPEPQPPTQAGYFSDDPDFVRGFWQRGGDGFDRLFIANEVPRDGADRLIDVFSVDDVYVSGGGSGDGARRFTLTAILHDMLDDVSLDQSFEVTSADVDQPQEFLSGRIAWSSIGPFSLVDFVIDRLTVRPGRCVAP
jgi:hypothetical protein